MKKDFNYFKTIRKPIIMKILHKIKTPKKNSKILAIKRLSEINIHKWNQRIKLIGTIMR